MKYTPQTSRPATDLTTTFGRTLAALRHAVGLTQPELAEEIPIERTALTRFELGRTTVGVPLLLSLERVFLDLNALRRHGDLLHLAAETATRLRRTGALVYADRPPSDQERVPAEALDEAARAAVADWAAALRADGIPFGKEKELDPDDTDRFEQVRVIGGGEGSEAPEDLEDAGPLPRSSRYLRTARARDVEVQQRSARRGRGRGE